MVLGSSYLSVRTIPACSRRSDSGVWREGREREKIRRKRGKGREEGTPVRFVFKRSFGLFFRLVSPNVVSGVKSCQSSNGRQTAL